MKLTRDELLLEQRLEFYRFDPLGPETWMEDHLSAFITDFDTGQQSWCKLSELPDKLHPETGRSYAGFWEWQKREIIRPAMSRDEHGRLKYHTVILCVPRGEGKSYINCMMMLYRFFCFPRQQIAIGSNSRDQSRFSLYDIMKEFTLNSEPLQAIIGSKGVREKSILLRDNVGNVVSQIFTVSTFTGIMSNITCLAFSEFFLSEPTGKFFVQLDSSRRNIPDSQAFIDTTVSTKDHLLYKLYTVDDEGIFFYYSQTSGKSQEFHHPMMNDKQLGSFRKKYLPADFQRFFLNKWDGDIGRFFSDKVIRAIHYVGESTHIMRTVEAILKLEEDGRDARAIADLQHQLKPVPYSLGESGIERDADRVDLQAIADMLDSNVALGVGIDCADALKDDLTIGARTIVALIAKLLPGSRSNPQLFQGVRDTTKLDYHYCVLSLRHIQDNTVDSIIWRLNRYLQAFDSLQSLCGERYGLAGLKVWGEDFQVPSELIQPTKAVQRASFNLLYQVVQGGRFKCPELALREYNGHDILEAEMQVFQYDSSKVWYGSPYKEQATGVQDDALFAVALGIYGMRNIGPNDFIDFSNTYFGELIVNDEVLGVY